MTITNSTDDELSWAVVRYLTLGPGSAPPFAMRVNVLGRPLSDARWLSGRAETFEAFAHRFPSQMDKPKPKLKRKRKS